MNQYIQVKKSGIHNRGVFAKKDIPTDTRIIEYVGEKVTHAEADRRTDKATEKNKKNGNNGAVYAFILNKRYCIDGNVSYNKAKYINHSCDPNSEVDIIRGHIWIIALKDIKKGEEITYNYNFDFDDEWEEHPCRCNAKRCIGYILDEDDWPKLKRAIKKKKSTTKR